MPQLAEGRRLVRHRARAELDADSGTVTVTAFDDNGFTGSFSLTFPGGGTLTGTFDVVWDIEAYAG